MVSQANLQTLAKGGGKYLLAMPMRRGDEVTETVLSRAGRYRSVAENLEVKEVIVGDGERRRRYAVCFNPLPAAHALERGIQPQREQDVRVNRRTPRVAAAGLDRVEQPAQVLAHHVAPHQARPVVFRQ